MNKPGLILKIFGALAVAALAGFSLFSAVDMFRPKTGLEGELAKTKKMLRGGFDKNKNLVAENTAMSEKLLQLLQQADDKEKENESLRKQLEIQLGYMRRISTDKEKYPSFRRILEAEMRQHKRSVSQRRVAVRPYREKSDQLEKNLAEQNKYIADLEEQTELLLTQADGLRQEMEKLNKRLQQKEDQIAELQDQLDFSLAAGTDEAQVSSQESASEKFPTAAGSGAPSDVMRQEIAKEYLGTIEDLVNRIKSLKAERDAMQSRLMDKPLKMSPQEKDKYILELRKELGEAKKQAAKDRLTFFYNLGVVYTNYGLYKEAAEVYEKALAIDASDASIHYNLAILYDEHLGRKADGIKHYEAFLLLKPDSQKTRDVEHWIYLAKRFLETNRKSRTESARAAFEHMFLTSGG